MDERITTVLDALSAAGIEHDPSSLKKHESQGLMSSVYRISSPLGELIIHHTAVSPSLAKFRIWEKLKPVSTFLCAIPGVPAAEVFLTVKLPHHFICVQKRLPGHSAGTVAITDGAIVLDWKGTKDALEKQLEEIFARVHAAPIGGFGELVVDGDLIRGEHDSWETFLKTDVPRWIETIAEADTIRSAPDRVTDDAYRYLETVLPFVSSLEKASLVSCDAINPSNVLIEANTVTGIVDWEWAFAADPAWEFAYMNPFALTHYFSKFPALSSSDAQLDFHRRSAIYELFLYMRWCYSTSGEPHGDLFAATRERVKKTLLRTPALFEKFEIG